MKAYTDVFGNPITKDEVHIAAAYVIAVKNPSALVLTRRMGMGYGKALRIMELLEDAGVISPLFGLKRTVLLKTQDQAVNAALRQFKKGKR